MYIDSCPTEYEISTLDVDHIKRSAITVVRKSGVAPILTGPT